MPKEPQELSNVELLERCKDHKHPVIIEVLKRFVSLLDMVTHPADYYLREVRQAMEGGSPKGTTNPAIRIKKPKK